MSKNIEAAYAVRLGRSIEYIEAHLEGDLSLDILSRVAGLSKYHYHRLFGAYTGTTVAKLVRRLRLKRATWDLAFSPEKKIIDIALNAGFTNPETFTRAFTQEQGQKTSEFRVQSKWREWGNV